MIMQMFPDPDLAEVLRRDRHHQLAAQWLRDIEPRPRTGRLARRLDRRTRRAEG